MDANDLENAISSAKDSSDVKDGAKAPASPQVPSEEGKMTGEQEVGFHKGALNTLVAERNELVKMVGNVEAIASAHVKRLEELGVKMSK